MGNGQQGAFTITYTLHGGLQDQQTLARAANSSLIVRFFISDFGEVLNCGDQNILPYYVPPEDGKVFDLIGAELTSLYNVYSENGSYISDDIFQIVGSSVLIGIIAQPEKIDSLLITLQAPEYGLTGALTDEENLLITGLFPVENLLSLNLLPQYINFARPVYPALGDAADRP